MIEWDSNHKTFPNAHPQAVAKPYRLLKNTVAIPVKVMVKTILTLTNQGRGQSGLSQWQVLK